MIKKEQVIFFDTDDELTNYCLDMNPVVMYNDEIDMPYYDYAFTPMYDKAIADDKYFTINDKDSKVMKRGCVTRGIISKPICNLVNTWEIDDEEDE